MNKEMANWLYTSHSAVHTQTQTQTESEAFKTHPVHIIHIRTL